MKDFECGCVAIAKVPVPNGYGPQCIAAPVFEQYGLAQAGAVETKIGLGSGVHNSIDQRRIRKAIFCIL